MELVVSVVLPAAGCGERMNASRPKQFCKVGGKTIISHTIDAFARIPWLQNIIVTTSPEGQSILADIYQGEEKVKIVLGGTTRHRSILNGIKMLAQVSPQCDVVVIHDGVRPLIEEDLLKDVVCAAHEYGAAGVVRPLVSTVISVDDSGFLDHSLPRSQYRASEMPQAFRYRIIDSAYRECTDYDLDYGTECLHLAQKYARSKVKLLDGPEYLWKLTYKKDLYAFEGVLKEKTKLCASLVGFDDVQDVFKHITHSLTEHGFQYQRNLTSNVSTVIVCLSALDTEDTWLTRCSEAMSNTSVQCIICVLTLCNTNTSTELFKAFTSFIVCLQSANRFKEKVVYGLFLQNLDMAKLIEILMYLAQETPCVLSGQIFTV